MRKRRPTKADLEAALDTFARVWRINRGFKPDEHEGMYNFTPGAWPTMGECKKANDLLEALGHEF